jgi:hypothetical protein
LDLYDAPFGCQACRVPVCLIDVPFAMGDHRHDASDGGRRLIDGGGRALFARQRSRVAICGSSAERRLRTRRRRASRCIVSWRRRSRRPPRRARFRSSSPVRWQA